MRVYAESRADVGPAVDGKFDEMLVQRRRRSVSCGDAVLRIAGGSARNLNSFLYGANEFGHKEGDQDRKCAQIWRVKSDPRQTVFTPNRDRHDGASARRAASIHLKSSNRGLQWALRRR